MIYVRPLLLHLKIPAQKQRLKLKHSLQIQSCLVIHPWHSGEIYTIGHTFLLNLFQQMHRTTHNPTKQNTKNIHKSLPRKMLNTELHRSILKSHDSAPGPAHIYYQMLKHVPENALTSLLNIYNNIWTTGNLPSSWREATVIPMPKPHRDHTSPTNKLPSNLLRQFSMLDPGEDYQ